MNRVILLTMAALMVVLATCAFAFSSSLQGLHLNAASFQAPIFASAEAAPMTSADEAQVSAPSGETVRLDEYSAPTTHLCQRGHASGSGADFQN